MAQTIKGHLRGTTALTTPDPLKADFRNFVFAVWKHLGLPDPTPLQYDISQFLQHGPRRLVIQAFRGVGKSWLTVAFVCWLLYCDPQHKVLVVSASAPLANEFSAMVKGLIGSMPLLEHLKPSTDQRQSMVAFDVGPAGPDKAPSVKSVGITGQITGSRAMTIVADDVEIPKNSDTQVKRDKLQTDIKEFDAVLKPGGRIIYLGTPQTENSIYEALPGRGYTIRIWPARIPSDPDKKLEPIAFAEKKYGGKLAPYIMKKMREGQAPGSSTDPLRFTDEDLGERELSYGRSGFALQFQLDTSLADAHRHPLKLADLIVHPLDPFRAPSDLVWASSPDLMWGEQLPLVGLTGDRYYHPAWVSNDYLPYQDTIMFVDPSGKGRDETAYAVVKLLHGRLFLAASGGFLGGYEAETLEKLLLIAKKHSVPKILAEPNFGGGMFSQLLKAAAIEHYPCQIEDADWQSAMKEQRIVDTLEPILNQHKLVVSPEVIVSDYESVLGREYDSDRAHYYRLMYQLSHMVREKGALAQDDRLDSLAGAVNHFLPYISTNSEKAHLQAKEDAFDAELEKFMQGVLFGNAAASPPRPFASKILSDLHRRRS